MRCLPQGTNDSSEVEALKLLSSPPERGDARRRRLHRRQAHVRLRRPGAGGDALSTLLQEFSPPGKEWTRTFTGKVRVVKGTVPVDKFLSSPQAAVALVHQALDIKKMHAVVAGDSLWRIAQDYGSTIDRVRRANPGVDFRYIKAGQTIVVPVGVAPISVQAWKEIVVPASGGRGRSGN